MYYDTYCCFRNTTTQSYRILWELTTRCNEKCSFCHVKNEEELTLNQILYIFNKIKLLNISDIIFTGGEPLLREDLFEIFDLVKNENINIDLCTNGTLIDNNLAIKLKKYTSEVSISLDACNATLYKDIRGGNEDYFSKVVNGIKLLVAAGHEVHITTVVTKKNYNYLREIVDFVEALGVKSISFCGLITELSTKGYKDISEINLNLNELSNTRYEISKLRKENRKIIINSKRIFKQQINDNCRAGKNILGITCDGRLLPCILLKNNPGINLLNTDDLSDLKLTCKTNINTCLK